MNPNPSSLDPPIGPKVTLRRRSLCTGDEDRYSPDCFHFISLSSDELLTVVYTEQGQQVYRFVSAWKSTARKYEFMVARVRN